MYRHIVIACIVIVLICGGHSRPQSDSDKTAETVEYGFDNIGLGDYKFK